MSDQQVLAPDDLGPIGETRVSAPMGIAAIALNMAMKYHDINTVQDGALYQQYKLEGKNMTPLHLDMVFETAQRIELYLLAANERVSRLMVEAVFDAVKNMPDDLDEAVGDEAPAAEAAPSPENPSP